ncbi:MAG TPA: response regulator [Candidatus Angelobacter sp.]
MSILLADDDVQLATFLSKSLESEGYSVRTAVDESSVLSELKRQNYKLIILDLNFGRTDGLRLLEKLRSTGLETPVLVLSARNRVSDRVQSLNLGADDYVTKPFSFQELAARANAILRRKADRSLSVLRVEDLEMDPAARKVHRGKREVKLSPKEFDLLVLLMRRAGETVSRRQLLLDCWGTHETDSNLVDVYVNYLRKKIDSASAEKLIQTVRGSGYRLGKPAPATGLHHQSAYHAAHHPEAAAQPGVADQLRTAPLKTLVHAIAHDLAQPLTSIRCFLEMLAIRKEEVAAQPAEMATIEQQADRAIALAKAISALVREAPAPLSPWISLETLFNELAADFGVLLQSGQLTLERQWEPGFQVSSSPALRQLLVLFLSKLVGRNAHPFVITVAASVRDGRCHLDLRWRPCDPSPRPVQDFSLIVARELASIREIMCSLGGELVLPEGQPDISLILPATARDRVTAVIG